MNEIEEQFDYIEDRGTRIVIWNLRKIENSEDFELDFNQESDILLGEAVSVMSTKYITSNTHNQTVGDNRNMDSEINEYLVSLKMYLNILYMVPKMKFILRGKRVR